MFLTALIIVESSFNSKARSSRGAIGLMQIIPRTGVALATEKKIEWNGKPTLYNPQTNIALHGISTSAFLTTKVCENSHNLLSWSPWLVALAFSAMHACPHPNSVQDDCQATAPWLGKACRRKICVSEVHYSCLKHPNCLGTATKRVVDLVSGALSGVLM